jgi:type II secretory pathway predicted ATPase ExeA
MNSSPFLFHDFTRTRDALQAALCDDEEAYILLTGETGTGKTALLRQLRSTIDRARYRVVYFSQSQRLNATGLVRVLSRNLRVKISLSHSESLDRLVRALSEETQHVLLWLDEAHELPHETLTEVRALVESDLEGERRVQVFLVGLPRLRTQLQEHPPLWRRLVVREEITGLLFEELTAFLEHHFPSEQVKRLCDQGQSILFERSKGAPGILLPMFRCIHKAHPGKGKLDPAHVEDSLQRWDLP